MTGSLLPSQSYITLYQLVIIIYGVQLCMRYPSYTVYTRSFGYG